MTESEELEVRTIIDTFRKNIPKDLTEEQFTQNLTQAIETLNYLLEHDPSKVKEFLAQGAAKYDAIVKQDLIKNTQERKNCNKSVEECGGTKPFDCFNLFTIEMPEGFEEVKNKNNTISFQNTSGTYFTWSTYVKNEKHDPAHLALFNDLILNSESDGFTFVCKETLSCKNAIKVVISEFINHLTSEIIIRGIVELNLQCVSLFIFASLEDYKINIQIYKKLACSVRQTLPCANENNSNPFADVSFAITGEYKSQNSIQYCLQANYNGTVAGFVITIENRWEKQELDARYKNLDENFKGYFHGKAALSSLGECSEKFIDMLSAKYGVHAPTNMMARDICFNAICLSGDPNDLPNEQVKIKLTHESDDNAEFFIILKRSHLIALFAEKLSLNRSNILKVLTQS